MSTPSSPRPDAWRRPPWWLLAALAAPALLAAAYHLSLLAAEHGVERVEIHVRALALWWQTGQLPYLPSGALPMLQNPYGPVYLGLLTVADAAGLSSGYAAGRVLSLLCLGAVLLMVARHAGGRGAAAWLVACLPLTTKPVVLFAVLYRVDTLALAFAVAGFVLSISESRGRRVAGALLFVFAFATKMTFLAAPAAVVAWHWLSGEAERRRRAVALAAFLAVALPGVVGAMEWLTGGAYLASAAQGNLPTEFSKCFDMLGRNGLWLFWWLAVVSLARRTGEGWRAVWGSPAGLYVLASLGTSSAFAANPLSSWNYLLEPVAALALFTAELLRRHGRRGQGEEASTAARRAARLLAVHGALSLLVTAQLVLEERRDHAEHAAEVEAASTCFEDLDPGARVAALGSLPAVDALLARGVAPLVAATAKVEDRPEVHALVADAWREGRLDRLYLGPKLPEDSVLLGAPGDCQETCAGGLLRARCGVGEPAPTSPSPRATP